MTATNKHKIVFVVSSLACGGAERVAVLISAGLAENGHDVSIITYSNPDSDFYSLLPSVKRIALNVNYPCRRIKCAVQKHWRRFFSLRSAILSEQPDLVISFVDTINVLTLLSLMGTRVRVIATEHCAPQMTSLGFIWRVLRRATYRRLPKLVSVSAGVDEKFSWMANKRRAVIYNPLAFTADDVVSAPIINLPSKLAIIAMGRLTEQKAFDVLIRAFAMLAPRFPDWSLYIFGEGSQREYLINIVANHGLRERVHMPGQTASAISALKAANIFVLSSHYEGFGNVIIEAMACGLPVISTDCPSGPNEIIDSGVNGILVPPNNPEIMSEAITQLILDDHMRRRLANAGSATVREFTLEKVISRWENVIADTLR